MRWFLNHLPSGSVVPGPRGWQPGDRKPEAELASCLPMPIPSTVLGTLTDLIQTAFVSLPLVLVGLGKR